MASIKQIVVVISVSVLLIVALSFWIGFHNSSPELFVETSEELEGPISPEEVTTKDQSLTNTMNRIATFSTNYGIIKIELFEDQMPITTGNFIALAESGFYDGTKFHRVIPNFMIQGGDPYTKGDDESLYGRGGPEKNIPDEFVEGELLTNTRGTIAMANTGQPNSGGSQFFINTVDNTNLDYDEEPLSSKHPVFGRVIEGMDVVDAISRVETEPGGIPAAPVIVESIVIE